MKKTFAHFGIPSNDIEVSRRQIEKLFGEELRGVSSDLWGLYYTSKTWGKDNVVSVFTNFSPNEGDGYWNEPEHTQFPLLLSVVDSPNFVEIQKLVLSDPALGAVLISREEIDV